MNCTPASRLRLNFLLFAATLVLTACGGGGDSGNDPAPPPISLPAPSALSYPSPLGIRLSTAMTAVMPTVTGSVASYSVSPALPAGITLNATTGQIAGTPTASAAPTTYTVTATNSGGSTTFGLFLKVFTLDVQSGAIARLAAEHAPISPEVVVRPVHFDPGALYVTATDPSGLILPAVGVTANADGTYSLVLTTNPSVSPGVFSGSVTLRLCHDAACALPQDIPSIGVAFNIRVLRPSDPWPGDNRTPLVAWAGAPEWSTVQGNASHTGLVPIALQPDKFTLRWKSAGYQVYGSRTPLKPNLVTWNGMFFVVSSEYLQGGVVYARRESDASEVWRFNVTGMSYPAANPVSVSNGIAYFAVGHQGETYMLARNATDGTAIFMSPMASQWEGYYSPTIGPNGLLYANAGTYGGLYAFNPSGNQLFFAGLSQVTNWTPAVSAGGVYAYTGDSLKVLDPLTGVVNVSIQDPAFQNYVYDLGGAPVLGDTALHSVFGAAYSNALLNGGNIGNNLTNFRTNTGTISWQAHGAYPTTPGYRNGVVYAVNNVPVRLEARAESDGALLWWWTPDSANESTFVSEVLLTDTHALVSSSYATHVIDLKTHKSVWSYPMSGKLALSANGILYIHNNTDLVAVNLR
jgi:hypothetical protein